MNQFYYSLKINVVIFTALFFATLVSVNAQKKRPDYPYVTNLDGCTNPIVGCSLFSNPQNYTCASSFTYTAATNNNNCLTGSSSTNYGCLYTSPNQMWFVVTVVTGGNLTFSFNNSAIRDIDGAIWGPIANGDLSNACATTNSTPITCDYSGSNVITMSINNAIAGQKYVMLITNYSNSTTDINIGQPSGGTVSYCKVNTTTCVAPTVAVSGNSTINQGQTANITLSFTGNAPYNYTLSDGQTGTISSNPLTLSVAPLSTTTYTVTSVSNACGAGTSSGSGTVTVLRAVDLITCFPMNGNTSDQIGGNNGTLNTNGGSASYASNRNGTSTSALSISNGAYVEFPTNNLLNNTFTHSVWVSPASLPTNGSFNYILSIGGIGFAQELCLENQGGTIKWVFRSSTNTGNVDVIHPSTVNIGQWYHVAIVRTINALQMYIDGVLVRSSPASGLASAYASNSIGRLGSQSSGLVNFFNGRIDDVRLFRGGLNSLEIASLYNSTLNCPAITGTPLISVSNITNSSLCRNQLENVNFQQSEVPTGSTYTVQLSDANGGFVSPTNIGSGTVPPIQVSVPTSVTTSGSGYRIRVVNGSVISLNTLPVTILPTATGNITGTITINQGQTSTLTMSFTGTAPWIYGISDGQNIISYTSNTATATQTVSPVVSTTYTLSSVKDNVCGIGTTSGSAIVTVNSNTELLACYPFNGNAQDSKGTFHGTVNGATLTTDRFGNANSAYSFNGSSFIELANPNDFRNNIFTYSAWVNPTVLPISGDFKSIIGISSGQVLGINYMNEPSWAMTAYNNSSTSYDIHPSSNIGVSINTWRHITIVRNSTQLKIYVDGTLVRTSSTSIPTTPTYTNSNSAVVYKAMIGTRPDATNIQFFNGKIDDVKIYRGALNDTQVQALFLAEQQCPTVETGGLIALTNVSSSTTCPNGNITVSAVTNSLQVGEGNPLIVELSNALGSFTNPIQIGTGITNNITCTIPSNTVAGNYKIRIVSGTNPNQVMSVNTLSIIVNPAVTATISGTTTILRGNSAALTLSFTGVGPWTYTLSGINLTATTSSSTVNVSVSPTTTTTYTLQSVSNACGAGTTSGSAIVTVNTIPQLIACYKFDGNALDSKGNHHGTVNGVTLTSDRFGRANSAYNFDGSSNIQLNNPADFGIATFTWSAWVNASELATLNVPKTVFSAGYDGGDQHLNMYYLSGQAGWNYGSYTGYTTAALPIMISYTSVFTNNWVHLAIVRTQTERKLYINGQLSLSGTAAPAFYNTPISAAIGSRYNGIQPFSGKIDDVKIYNGALTDEDVLLLYNEEQGECSEPCSGMIYSLSSGNWNVPTTWSCGRVPDLTDKVLIKAGHTITISTNDAKAKKLLNNGQVSFTNSTSKLIFN